MASSQRFLRGRFQLLSELNYSSKCQVLLETLCGVLERASLQASVGHFKTHTGNDWETSEQVTGRNRRADLNPSGAFYFFCMRHGLNTTPCSSLFFCRGCDSVGFSTRTSTTGSKSAGSLLENSRFHQVVFLTNWIFCSLEQYVWPSVCFNLRFNSVCCEFLKLKSTRSTRNIKFN